MFKEKDKYEVQIVYKNNISSYIRYIKYIEDDIIIDYDDETSSIPEILFVQTDNQAYTIEIDKVKEVYINTLDKNNKSVLQFLFWKCD